MNVLDRKVFVLNRNWLLIDSKPVREVLGMMATDAATALDIQGEDCIRPVKWDEWIQLPILRPDEAIHSPKMTIRQPTVVVAVNYAKVPKRKPKFTLKNIARTYGYRCAYTGKLLSPEEWSKDHVNPLSRGGKDVPENVVLAWKEVNNKKGAKTPHEAGLPTPKIRRLLSFLPEPTHPDHELFAWGTQ